MRLLALLRGLFRLLLLRCKLRLHILLQAILFPGSLYLLLLLLLLFSSWIFASRLDSSFARFSQGRLVPASRPVPVYPPSAPGPVPVRRPASERSWPEFQPSRAPVPVFAAARKRKHVLRAPEVFLPARTLRASSLFPESRVTPGPAWRDARQPQGPRPSGRTRGPASRTRGSDSSSFLSFRGKSSRRSRRLWRKNS